jgi:hypothetical protein
MLGAVGVWGSTTGGSPTAHVVLAVGVPLAFAVAWWLFAAPKARVRLPMAGIVAFKVAVFGCAAMAIDALGRPRLAACFAAVAVANTVIATIDRDAAVRSRR